MSIPLNISAFRDIIFSSMDRLERLERTPKGRKQLIAEYQAGAKHLRETSGIDQWRQAGGEMNTHVASPAELARRALERADQPDKQIDRLKAIKGIYEPYAAYLN